MPFDATAGFSDNWTPEKYDLTSSVLTTWGHKARAVGRKYEDVRFAFIDGTAGTGSINGRAGTPIQLARLAEAMGAPVLAFERNPDTYDRLREQLPASTICADSLDFLRDQNAKRALQPMRFGLLIYDPNPGDGLLPVEELCNWGRGNRRDLLVFVAASQAYKRAQRAGEFEPHVRALEEVWDGVCLTQPRFDMQWLAIFCTRWADLAKDVCRRCGFDLIDEPQGKEWLWRASTVGAGSGIKGQTTLPIEVGGMFPYE